MHVSIFFVFDKHRRERERFFSQQKPEEREKTSLSRIKFSEGEKKNFRARPTTTTTNTYATNKDVVSRRNRTQNYLARVKKWTFSRFARSVIPPRRRRRRRRRRQNAKKNWGESPKKKEKATHRFGDDRRSVFRHRSSGRRRDLRISSQSAGR